MKRMRKNKNKKIRRKLKIKLRENLTRNRGNNEFKTQDLEHIEIEAC